LARPRAVVFRRVMVCTAERVETIEEPGKTADDIG
jgi:hypothetical protein